MKIRQGFVSNSSSSSFIIYGICMEKYDIAEKLKNSESANEEMEDGFYKYFKDFNKKNKTQIQYYDVGDKNFLGINIKQSESESFNFSIFEKDLAKYKKQLEQVFNKLFGENSKDFLKHAAIHGGTYFS